MPVTSMLLVLQRNAAFSLFLLHKLSRSGLKKLWTICMVSGFLTPTVRLIFQRLYRWGLDMSPVGKSVVFGSIPAFHSLLGLGCRSTQQSLTTWAVTELSFYSLTLPFYPGHLKYNILLLSFLHKYKNKIA